MAAGGGGGPVRRPTTGDGVGGPSGGDPAGRRQRRPRRGRQARRPRPATRRTEVGAGAATASRWSGTDDRNADGTPTDANPGLTIADFGPAPIGVPNFVIDQFTIPPFLLPIYQACGTEYGIPWQVLASINRIETAFGTNLNVSTAGALGWMQFIPSTWEAYGVDANNDGRKDPYNPVDAICAAARYLQGRRRRGGPAHRDLRLQPRRLVRRRGPALREPVRRSSPTTWSARSPGSPRAPASRSPPTPATPTTSPSARPLERSKPGKRGAGNVADVISSSPTRRGINIYSREGAPVVAVNDGVITDDRQVEASSAATSSSSDAYGNRFTYAELGEVAEVYPVPKQRSSRPRTSSSSRPTTTAPERARDRRQRTERRPPAPPATATGRRRAGQHRGRPRAPLRLPRARRDNVERAGLTGQLDELLSTSMPGYETLQGLLLRRPAVRPPRRWSCGR